MSTLAQGSTAIAIFIGLLAAYWISSERLKLPLPPGPTRSFWSGNASQIPLQVPWQTFAQWTKTYGTCRPILVGARLDRGPKY